jgi:radical SAM family uncharacterized protein/radical SAM-linked protein
MTDRSSILEEQILPLVRKPGRYVGEFAIGCEELPAGRGLRVLLAFPDTCEVGASNLGIRILAAAASRIPGVLVDFCFAPWPDFEHELRRRQIPLSSVCHSIPLSEFDVVGFSLQYELQYTNVLNMLELGGIPLLARDREAAVPLVVAGGGCAFNPEPLSDFMDCFSLGDGEDTIVTICKEVETWKKGKADRKELLQSLSKQTGIYVPSLYEVRCLEDGTNVRDISLARPVRPAMTPRIGDVRPLLFLPRVEVTHDRLNVEVMRGCTRGCRFCMAGFIYRPVREKATRSVLEEVTDGFSKTGYEELSLMSLSTPDYSGLPFLLPSLDRLLSVRGVEVTLPSMRPDTLTLELVRDLDRFKKSGLTLAPEAGAKRLRDVVNKGMEDEEIIGATELASSFGWNLIKLYFMIGLPTETDEDVEAIPLLVEKALRRARKANSRVTFNVSVSAFTPKPHTPFQWEAQLSPDDMAARIKRVAAAMKRLPVKVRWRDPQVSFLEGILARGDRRAGAAVRLAFERGARLDAWSDFFCFSTWLDAFRDAGLDPELYSAARSTEFPLPWDHIEVVSREFLRLELARAREGKLTQDCRSGLCAGCGVLTGRELSPEEICLALKGSGRDEPVQSSLQPVSSYSTPAAGARRHTGGKYRFQYEKSGRARFLSHLDMVRIFTRALRASGLPVAYSEGFRKRPRVSFGPPLPLGFTSTSEYLDIELESAPEQDPAAELNRLLPRGVRIVEWKRLEPGTQSLSSSCTLARYSVVFPEHVVAESGLSREGLSETILAAIKEFDGRRHITISKERNSKTREVSLGAAVKELTALEPKQVGLEMVLSLSGPDVLRPEDVAQALLPDVKFEKKCLLVERNAVYLRGFSGTGAVAPI